MPYLSLRDAAIDELILCPSKLLQPVRQDMHARHYLRGPDFGSLKEEQAVPNTESSIESSTESHPFRKFTEHQLFGEAFD